MSTSEQEGLPSAGADGSPPPPQRLDVARALEGRRLLVTGATGFVGKVALSMLLHRYPDVGQVFVLVRPGRSGTADARFFETIAASPPFAPVRRAHGAAYEAFLRQRCTAVAGDVSEPLFGLSPAALESLGRLDAIVNCAGLVDFTPPLDVALSVNVGGARHAIELARRTGAALVHVSTCYVAGNRSGEISEDEPIEGFFPRRAGDRATPRQGPLDPSDFDLDRELADCELRVSEARAEACDASRVSLFRERAGERLREEGRGGDDAALRAQMESERKAWIARELVDVGMERARHWGWPNTYTYTKSLGEQLIARSGLTYAIVRPSIVETALRYPFPGWNEGFTTSAPLAYMALKGQRVFPIREDAIFDVIPVDHVAAGIVMVTAAKIAEASGAPPRPGVFQLASGDSNPLEGRRALELTAEYRRRFFQQRERGSKVVNELLARVEPQAVSKRRYQLSSFPALSRAARAAHWLLDEEVPRWGNAAVTAVAGALAERLEGLEEQWSKAKGAFDLFLPFLYENRYVFQCGHVRALWQDLEPADAERLPWDVEKLDWPAYWLDVHVKGLEQWVFRGFSERRKKALESPREHRDLRALLEAASEAQHPRVALRVAGARRERLTFGELRGLAHRVALFLAAAGVRHGDRVLLVSENRPEWAVAFFGIIEAGGVVVLADAASDATHLEALARGARARAAVFSQSAFERLGALAERWRGSGPHPIAYQEAAAGGPAAELPWPSPEDPAVLAFAGVDGDARAVAWTHQAIAAQVAKLARTLDVGPGDRFLSVLPLHRIAELTAGLLLPLSRGAEVEYLDDPGADRVLSRVESGRVTGIVAEPALWSALEQRVERAVSGGPGARRRGVRALMELNGALRARSGPNLGRLLFSAAWRKLGDGRLRWLVSVGPSLSPALQDRWRNLGLDLRDLREAAEPPAERWRPRGEPRAKGRGPGGKKRARREPGPTHEP